MMVRGARLRLGVTAAVIGSAALTGSPAAAAPPPLPPTLDGEYVFLYDADSATDDGGFTAACDPSGTSTLVFDTSTPGELPILQFVPDVGYFDPGPNPIPRDVPYAGPIDLRVETTLAAHTLPPMPYDFETGWYNEQVGTRGLASAPVTALSASLRVVTATATVEATIELPAGSTATGSCYGDLSGAQLDVGPPLASGRQYHVRALELAYRATVTTSAGTFLDRGTVSMSFRNEIGFYSTNGGFFGHGVEATFTSALTEVESTDATPPTVTCSPATAVLRQPNVVVNATVTDTGSGPEQATLTAPVDTSTVGRRTVSFTGRDLAGNETTVQCPVTVQYAFSGFSAPIDNAPTVNRVKAGEDIDVKWRITDFYGVGVSDPASFVSLTTGSSVCSPSDPITTIERADDDDDSGATYRGQGRWRFEWETPKAYAGMCRVMSVNLADGTNHTALFRFSSSSGRGSNGS